MTNDKRIIEITSSNYKDYMNLDIIAFSFAGEGAQGECGGIILVTSDGTVYHTNFIRDIDIEEVFDICPTLKECTSDVFRFYAPKGWSSFYLGGGNFLIVKEEFQDAFASMDPYELYGQWIEILLKKVKV